MYDTVYDVRDVLFENNMMMMVRRGEQRRGGKKNKKCRGKTLLAATFFLQRHCFVKLRMPWCSESFIHAFNVQLPQRSKVLLLYLQLKSNLEIMIALAWYYLIVSLPVHTWFVNIEEKTTQVTVQHTVESGNVAGTNQVRSSYS